MAFSWCKKIPKWLNTNSPEFTIRGRNLVLSQQLWKSWTWIFHIQLFQSWEISSKSSNSPHFIPIKNTPKNRGKLGQVTVLFRFNPFWVIILHQIKATPMNTFCNWLIDNQSKKNQLYPDSYQKKTQFISLSILTINTMWKVVNCSGEGELLQS